MIFYCKMPSIFKNIYPCYEIEYVCLYNMNIICGKFFRNFIELLSNIIVL